MLCTKYIFLSFIVESTDKGLTFNHCSKPNATTKQTAKIKKVKRYYESLQYVDLKCEDPDADYNAVIECIIEDLNQWLKY